MHKLTDKGGVALTDRTTRVCSGYLFKEGALSLGRGFINNFLALGSPNTHVRLDLQPEGPILLRGRTYLVGFLIVAPLCELICSFIHETACVTFDLHEPHRVLSLAKHIKKAEDEVKVNDVTGPGVKICRPPLL